MGVMLLAIACAATTASAASSWSRTVTLGPTGRETGPPQVVVGGSSEAFVVWEGGRGSGIQVTDRRPGNRWRRPVELSGTRAFEPQIAAAGRWATLVWTQSVRRRRAERAAVFAATRISGGRWGAPENISASRKNREAEASDPAVAITDRGEAIAMWTAGDEKHRTTPFIKAATRKAGGEWASPIGLPGSIEGEEPLVEATPEEEAVSIWHAFYNEESGLESADHPADLRWSYPRRLANPGAFPSPELAITPSGEAVAAWEFEEPDGLQLAIREPGGRWRLRTVTSRADEETAAPRVFTGLDGTVAATWVRSAPTAGVEEDVFSIHRRGRGWTKPRSLFESEAEPRRPQIAVTRSGEWIAVWESTGPAGEVGVEASSRPRGGRWSAPVSLFTAPTGIRLGGATPRIAVAPNGEATAVWRGYDGTGRVIEAAMRP